MLILAHTIKHTVTTGEPTFTDHYALYNTMEEAQEAASRLISTRPNGLYCYGIAQVIESSEAHWKENNDAWGFEN